MGETIQKEFQSTAISQHQPYLGGAPSKKSIKAASSKSNKS
jgi:hypothetical protein